MTHVKVLIDKGYFESSFLARTFSKVVGAVPLKRSLNQSDRLEDKQNILQTLDSNDAKTPLLFFPEGWDTTAKKGLLLYQRYLFSLGRPIQPVSISASVPLRLPLNLSILGTSVFKETCWFFFFPYTTFRFNFLPVQFQKEHETDIEFARRVQELTADDLGIEATNFTYRDALKLRNYVISHGRQLPADFHL